MYKTIQNSVTTVINVASSELQSTTWYSKVLLKSIPVAPNETPFQIFPNYYFGQSLEFGNGQTVFLSVADKIPKTIAFRLEGHIKL